MALWYAWTPLPARSELDWCALLRAAWRGEAVATLATVAPEGNGLGSGKQSVRVQAFQRKLAIAPLPGGGSDAGNDSNKGRSRSYRVAGHESASGAALGDRVSPGGATPQRDRDGDGASANIAALSLATPKLTGSTLGSRGDSNALAASPPLRRAQLSVANEASE